MAAGVSGPGEGRARCGLGAGQCWEVGGLNAQGGAGARETRPGATRPSGKWLVGCGGLCVVGGQDWVGGLGLWKQELPFLTDHLILWPSRLESQDGPTGWKGVSQDPTAGREGILGNLKSAPRVRRRRQAGDAPQAQASG